ncbi:MAG: N-acetylmuramoyl-L-alanine amidase [Bdellovibrionales bacterium]|nr:N-acetylmuramoyl-L-alanine amidase [Bdellovibrionales bacterium]
MKRLILLTLLLHSVAYADDSGTDAILSYPYEEQTSPDNNEGDLIDVQKVSYIRNKKASFCTRPAEMVDTIVVHHSETPSTSTPQDINAFHLNRGSAADPWYMIAYSFVINSPYAGNTLPTPKASEGRPFEIVGAHAGSNIFIPMDAVQSALWDSKKILCGKENETPKYDPTLVKNKKIKANVTTIGIVINGNYSPYYIKGQPRNLNGYKAGEKRDPTESTMDMVARLSCQLQKKYPRIKTLSYHDQYHRTSCPGTFKELKNMERIQKKAKEYGCDFSLLSKRY